MSRDYRKLQVFHDADELALTETDDQIGFRIALFNPLRKPKAESQEPRA